MSDLDFGGDIGDIVYLAGPMSGFAKYNYPAFDVVAAKLRDNGYTVISPSETGLPPETEWAVFMRRGIAAVLKADVVATLPGWEDSTGACLEVQVATAIATPVKSWKELR